MSEDESRPTHLSDSPWALLTSFDNAPSPARTKTTPASTSLRLLEASRMALMPFQELAVRQNRPNRTQRLR